MNGKKKKDQHGKTIQLFVFLFFFTKHRKDKTEKGFSYCNISHDMNHEKKKKNRINCTAKAKTPETRSFVFVLKHWVYCSRHVPAVTNSGWGWMTSLESHCNYLVYPEAPASICGSLPKVWHKQKNRMAAECHRCVLVTQHAGLHVFSADLC